MICRFGVKVALWVYQPAFQVVRVRLDPLIWFGPQNTVHFYHAASISVMLPIWVIIEIHWKGPTVFALPQPLLGYIQLNWGEKMSAICKRSMATMHTTLYYVHVLQENHCRKHLRVCIVHVWHNDLVTSECSKSYSSDKKQRYFGFAQRFRASFLRSNCFQFEQPTALPLRYKLTGNCAHLHVFIQMLATNHVDINTVSIWWI